MNGLDLYKMYDMLTALSTTSLAMQIYLFQHCPESSQTRYYRQPIPIRHDICVCMSENLSFPIRISPRPFRSLVFFQLVRLRPRYFSTVCSSFTHSAPVQELLNV